jgi:hypothetical protein
MLLCGRFISTRLARFCKKKTSGLGGCGPRREILVCKHSSTDVGPLYITYVRKAGMPASGVNKVPMPTSFFCAPTTLRTTVKHLSWVSKPYEGHIEACPCASSSGPITFLVFTSISTHIILQPIPESFQMEVLVPKPPPSLFEESRGRYQDVGTWIDETAGPARGGRPFQGHKRNDDIEFMLN